jgi:thiamine pyrophosphokinase
MMKLPPLYKNTFEWTLVGPMGPAVPNDLAQHPLLVVDGGAGHTERMDIWIGDGDSYTDKINCEHIFSYPPEKSQSDLALALSALNSQHQYKLHLWGFLGGRKDHELFNLGECLSFLADHPESQILLYNAESEVSFHLLGEGEWSFEHHGPFSLGSIKNLEVQMTGDCLYPLRGPHLLTPLSSLGLSNEGSGRIFLQINGPLFVYFPEGRK